MEARSKRKHKRSRAETIATDIADKLLAMQNKSDQLMIELEEKELKFEEKQLEQEVQARREEREFQLQLMHMIMGQHNIMSGPPHSFGRHLHYLYGKMVTIIANSMIIKLSVLYMFSALMSK